MLGFRNMALFLLAILATWPLAGAEATGPNVILFIGDDISWNDFGCYGNEDARTPHIDALADEGLKFHQAYLTASSCSPSRSSIITGRYPHNNGKAAELHLAIPPHLPWFPALLRQAGYHTAIVGKHHMQVEGGGLPAGMKPFDVVDGGNMPGNHGGHGRWVQTLKERPQDQPFFGWFAAYDAHRGWEADREWDADRYGPKHRPQDVVVPPFLSDDPATRQDLASYYNEVTRFDYYIGQVVQQLRRENELDSTLILVLADNGRPFPRAKTRLHDSGMKTALVAHWPAGIRSGGVTTESLVSAIDLAPTILAAAGCEVPATMQGVPLQPVFQNADAVIREYAFSEHNWHDYEAHGRSIRTTDHLLIRNFRPSQPWQGPADSVRSPSHQQLQKLRDQQHLQPAQRDVFLAPRPQIELYETKADPHQLDNLAGNPRYESVQQHLSQVLATWRKETADSVPENLSQDSFDRETGERLKVDQYRGVTPGEDRGASHVNAAGPRKHSKTE